MEIFEYAFTRRAFIVDILLAAVIPCVGLVVVCKRLSIIGDTLPHTSLARVAVELILGLNPVLVAATACVATAVGIETIRRKVSGFSEVSITVVVSTGIGLAGVLSGFVENAANFNNFLFGNIVAISNGELYLVIAISTAVLLVFLLMYKGLLYVSLNEQSARLAEVPIKTVNFLFTVLITVTVSIAAGTVGALIVPSVMVVPVACAMQLGTSYCQALTFAMAFNTLFMTMGLFAAYYLRLESGGTIILVGVIFLILVFAGKRILRRK